MRCSRCGKIETREIWVCGSDRGATSHYLCLDCRAALKMEEDKINLLLFLADGPSFAPDNFLIWLNHPLSLN